MPEPGIGTAYFPGTYDADGFGDYLGGLGSLNYGPFSGEGPSTIFGSVPVPVPRPDRANGTPGGVNMLPTGGAYDGSIFAASPMVTIMAVGALGVLVWGLSR